MLVLGPHPCHKINLSVKDPYHRLAWPILPMFSCSPLREAAPSSPSHQQVAALAGRRSPVAAPCPWSPGAPQRSQATPSHTPPAARALPKVVSFRRFHAFIYLQIFGHA